jgi:hypothetical protein
MDPDRQGKNMTRFTKENLVKDGYCIFYSPTCNPYADDAKFVARFKRIAGAGSFMTHLRKNYTVEDYFAKLEEKSPLDIVEETGYLLPHIKKWIKEAGYPVTKAGHDAWWAEQMRKVEARNA